MIISANDLARTRLCAARDCANDAETGWALCRSCERRRQRGHPIPLHVIPEIIPDTLKCHGKCGQFKLDDDFPRDSSASKRRRYRHSECRACGSKRRSLERANRTPQQRDLELAERRERNRLQRGLRTLNQPNRDALLEPPT